MYTHLPTHGPSSKTGIQHTIEQSVELPTSSFYVRMAGDAMIDMGINDNDILIVHPSTDPQNGAIVVAVLEGNLVVRRYFSFKEQIYLVPENVNYPATEISHNEEIDICGVVVQVIQPS